MTNKTRKAYMCEVDYDWELGEAAGGSTLYPDIKDLKDHHACWKGCGIVEVEIKKTKVITPADWRNQKTMPMEEFASQEKQLRVKWYIESIKQLEADLSNKKKTLAKLKKELK